VVLALDLARITLGGFWVWIASKHQVSTDWIATGRKRLGGIPTIDIDSFPFRKKENGKWGPIVFMK